MSPLPSNFWKKNSEISMNMTRSGNVCLTLSHPGSGLWVKSAFDGHKFVCADDFYNNDISDNEGCLVYSFGLSDDASFEEAMAEAGCEVRTTGRIGCLDTNELQ